MDVFLQFKNDNDLTTAQLVAVVSKAFIKLMKMYRQFDLDLDESGVIILNFEDCTEEETGGWSQDEVENGLTDELLSIAEDLIA